MLERQVTCLVPGLNMETYHGHVRAPADAIILFEACRIGLLPRVQRRLSEKERQSIKSGSIFVWDEREAGMRRWTDGKSWSASRVSGSFLTYREMEGKRGGGSMSAPLFSGNAKKDSTKDSQDHGDEGPDGYRYKPDGLMKQSFSITTSSGQHLHLISYYSRSAVGAQNLMQPSTDPSLRHIRPEKGMYPESTVQDQNPIPAVTRGPMTSPGFAPAPHQSANIGSPYGPQATNAHQYPAYQHANWAPPSPMHTPPQHYAPYYPGAHPPPPAQPNGSQVGQSPLQQMHYPQYLQQYPPQQHAQTAFDRAPAPLSNSTLPPPQQHQPYAPAPSSYSQPSRYEQPPHHDSIAGPRHDSVHPKHSDESQSHAAGQQQQLSIRTTSPQAAPSSSAQTIPGIHSLINGAQAAHEEFARARTGSRSPGSRQLQDIPPHKLSFNPNNDARALRDLDKATFRI